MPAMPPARLLQAKAAWPATSLRLVRIKAARLKLALRELKLALRELKLMLRELKLMLRRLGRHSS